MEFRLKGSLGILTTVKPNMADLIVNNIQLRDPLLQRTSSKMIKSSQLSTYFTGERVPTFYVSESIIMEHAFHITTWVSYG